MEQEQYAVAELPKITKKEIDEYLYGSGTKLTEQQKAMFYQVASINGLNPFKREVYAIPYGDKFNIITGYEVYLKRAERSGKLAGWNADVTKEGDELIGVCTVYRKDWSQPFVVKAWFSEYNQGNKMWREKPRTMIRKVAIAQAFRMAFSEELGGMPYTADEITTGEVVGQADIVAPEPPKTSDKVTKAITWIEDNGLTKAEAEAMMGEEITEANLAKLKKVYKAWRDKASQEIVEPEGAQEATAPIEVACPNRNGDDVTVEYCNSKCESRQGCPAH